jgi:hypothetical protein
VGARVADRPEAELAPPDLASPLETPSALIQDDTTITSTSPGPSVLRDTVGADTSAAGVREYTITLTASVALPHLYVEVQTSPILQWSLPAQLPGGRDNLPPLQMWGWGVTDAGQNVTPQWSATPANETLDGVTSWTNQTIRVSGWSSPAVLVEVNSTAPDGTTTPGAGFVLNTPGVTGGIPANQSDLEAVASALHPGIVRFSTVLADTSLTWKTSTDQPQYNFTTFDRDVAFADGVGASVVLSLPAGSWGDGNVLPTGMPLNTSLAIPSPVGAGYFPQLSAWQEFVEGIVNHTVAAQETIEYWSIGNEVTDSNASVVAAYTQVFNAAATVIHEQLPAALVGSDAMLNTTYEQYYATHAQGVGFLSFHYYPALGMCITNGTYCPPSGPPNGVTDPTIFSRPQYTFLGGNYAPALGQRLWSNSSGDELPVLDTETNLNPMGGNPATAAIGTDPRIQSLLGASWVGTLLIDGAFQNVSEVAYYALSSGWGHAPSTTEPYGGWGFGLTSETSDDSTIEYAPYLALELWGSGMGAGQPGLIANSSAPELVESYATRDGPGLSVFLVNKVNVTVSIDPVIQPGGYRLACLDTLDQRSYVESYQSATGQTVLQSAGIATTQPVPGSAVTIEGYGVALLEYVPDTATVVACPQFTIAGAPPGGTNDFAPTVLAVSVTVALGVATGLTWLTLPVSAAVRQRLRLPWRKSR